MRTYRRIVHAIAAASALPLLAACGDDPTGVEGGTVTASMHDGTSSAAQAVQPSGSSSQSSSAYQGEASGSAQVYIFSEAQGWVDLGSPADVDVSLQSDNETTVHANVTVPADTYTRVRLVLDGFAAHLDAGAVIGGLTLTAAVDVTMGGSDAHVEIEKDVTPFTISANSSAQVRFDMNTEVWMDEETAESEEASDTEVEEATEAEAEGTQY